jgi:hypothetical protein
MALPNKINTITIVIISRRIIADTPEIMDFKFSSGLFIFYKSNV